MNKILITLLSLVFSVSHAQSDPSLRRRLPIAKCQVTANVTCNVIGSNIPCSQVVTPSNKCGPTPVRYSFKYSNKNSYGIFLNYTKFWAIMDGSNQRDKVDMSPMKPGETRLYFFNHTLNTCSVGTFGQIKVEGLLNVTTYNYCYSYDFIPNLVNTVASPTSSPTSSPILRPTGSPTPLPTQSPTALPISSPTWTPISKPTLKPNAQPPTLKPIVAPSSITTLVPSRVQVPTANDVSMSPTKVPVSKPVKKPSRSAKAP